MTKKVGLLPVQIRILKPESPSSKIGFSSILRQSFYTIPMHEGCMHVKCFCTPILTSTFTEQTLNSGHMQLIIIGFIECVLLGKSREALIEF